MSSGKLLLGVLAGVAAGALVGVLFAPEKGSVTRKKMLKKGDDYIDGLKEKFNSFLEEVKNEVEKENERSNDPVENGLAKMEKF